MAEWHGCLRSAVTGRAKVFRDFKLAGHVLGSLPCLMTAKTENAHVLPSLPLRPVSQIQFYRLMVPFRVDGHILEYESSLSLCSSHHLCLSHQTWLSTANLTLASHSNYPPALVQPTTFKAFTACHNDLSTVWSPPTALCPTPSLAFVTSNSSQ